MKNQPTPRMNPETPRLSVMCREAKHPYICQNCGGSHLTGQGNGILRVVLDRWQECDHNDKPELIVVVLCSHCARKIVQPHPRLYNKLAANAPFAGCMSLCVACKWRDGVTCKNPVARANGGEGVKISIATPINAMVDGRDFRGPVQLWPKPPVSCAQFEGKLGEPKPDLFQ